MGSSDFSESSERVRARERDEKHPRTAIPRPIDEIGAPAVVRAGLME